MPENQHVPEMPLDAVITLIKLFNKNNIEFHLDGGWAVDALLGEQTRKHADLDIVIQHTDVRRLRALLEARGYHDVSRPDTRECNFVMGNNEGHEIDFHTYLFDEKGNNQFGIDYPLESLSGSGTIGGLTVKCVPAAWLVKFHSGYELDGNDYHDVRLLCQRFKIAIPSEFKDFEKKQNRSARLGTSMINK